MMHFIQTVFSVCKYIGYACMIILYYTAIALFTTLYLTVTTSMKVYRYYDRKARQCREEDEYLRGVARARNDWEQHVARQQREERRRERQADVAGQREASNRQRHTSEDMHICRQYLEQCETSLAHRENMTSFPDPPFWPCGKSCGDNNGVLKACRHTIARVYRTAFEAKYLTVLPEDKRKWHPDRFARCPETAREGLKAKAAELFKIMEQVLEDGRKEGV
jgi:hypothetical protein